MKLYLISVLALALVVAGAIVLTIDQYRPALRAAMQMGGR